jgi:cell division protein FtsB
VNEGDFRSRPSGGIWHSLNRFLFTLIVLAAAVPVAHSFLPEVQKRKDQETRLQELQTEIDKQRMQLARYEHEATLLKRDREYIETLARDKFDLMKPGETIFRVDPAKPSPNAMRLKR